MTSLDFLLFTEDARFVLKTVSRAEARTLERMLPRYAAYMAGNPSSLVARFCAARRRCVREPPDAAPPLRSVS